MAKDKFVAEKFTLKNVRIGYAPGIFEKSAMKEGDEPKYSTKFILCPKKNKRLIEDLEDLIEDLKEEKWGKGKVRNLLSICLKDGDDMENEAYHGQMVVTCSSKKRPVVVDEDNEPITQDDDIIYSGCFVDATINVWVQDNSYGKRVPSILRAVRFKKDGDPIGGGNVDAETEFED